MGHANVGRLCRLIVRQPNGRVSIYSGALIREDSSSWTIRQDDGLERTEPKAQTAVEWLTSSVSPRAVPSEGL